MTDRDQPSNTDTDTAATEGDKHQAPALRRVPKDGQVRQHGGQTLAHNELSPVRRKLEHEFRQQGKTVDLEPNDPQQCEVCGNVVATHTYGDNFENTLAHAQAMVRDIETGNVVSDDQADWVLASLERMRNELDRVERQTTDALKDNEHAGGQRRPIRRRALLHLVQRQHSTFSLPELLAAFESSADAEEYARDCNAKLGLADDDLTRATVAPAHPNSPNKIPDFPPVIPARDR